MDSVLGRFVGLAGLALLPFGAQPLQGVELPASMMAQLEVKKSFEMDKFPIGFWNYARLSRYADKIDEKAVADWADCGFTIPTGPIWEPGKKEEKERIHQILDWCKKYDMKIILYDQRCECRQNPNPPDYAVKVKASYDDFGAHPATLGFYINDEPVGAMVPPTEESIRIHKQLSPKHHPFMNRAASWPRWNCWGSSPRLADYLVDYVKRSGVDLLAFDNYTQMWPGKHGVHPVYGENGWEWYFHNLVEYRLAALKAGVPYWPTLLCIGHMNYRQPNFNDLLWQFNTAVCAGASGVMYFYYYQNHMADQDPVYALAPIDGNWEKTQSWYDLKRINTSFHRNYGDLFNRLVSTKIAFHGEVFGGAKPFWPDGVLADVAPNPDESYANHPLMIGEFADAQLNRYVMVVNNSVTDPVAVDLKFPGDDTKLFKFEQGKEVPVTSGKLEGKTLSLKGQWLFPGQALFLKVESAAAASSPITIE